MCTMVQFSETYQLNIYAFKHIMPMGSFKTKTGIYLMANLSSHIVLP